MSMALPLRIDGFWGPRFMGRGDCGLRLGLRVLGFTGFAGSRVSYKGL